MGGRMGAVIERVVGGLSMVGGGVACRVYYMHGAGTWPGAFAGDLSTPNELVHLKHACIPSPAHENE